MAVIPLVLSLLSIDAGNHLPSDGLSSSLLSIGIKKETYVLEIKEQHHTFYIQYSDVR